MNDWRRWVVRLVAVALLICITWYVSRVPEGTYTAIDGEAFATTYKIRYAYGPNAQAVKLAVDAEMQRIDAMASTWREDSELMRYNRADDPDQFELTDDLSELIQKAMQIESQTGGAFSMRPDGMAIDLSGVAKGYAVDRVIERLQAESGVTDCLVDIGGEVRAIGNGPKGDGWRVGLYGPSQAAAVEAPVITLRNCSVATSGTYFKADHILDPATADPVSNNLLSASVIHPNNTTADALATAMFVMGHERGLLWAKEHDLHVIFLLEDGTWIEHQPAE